MSAGMLETSLLRLDNLVHLDVPDTASWCLTVSTMRLSPPNAHGSRVTGKPDSSYSTVAVPL